MDQIPVFNTISSKWKQSIVLADLLVDLEIHWNSRSEAFYMDIIDNENDYILTGVKLIPDWLLIRQFRAYMPNLLGDFIVVKVDDTAGDRITYDNFGVSYILYFYDSDEAEAWENENGVG